MPDPILTARQLNRALLARQLFLERSTLSIPAALEAASGSGKRSSGSAPVMAGASSTRDIKPDNIFLDTPEFALPGDFGMAAADRSGSIIATWHLIM